MEKDPRIEKRFASVAASTTFRNIIAAHDLDKKSVLDIGCSYGEFLACFGEGSMGVSISPDEAAYGRARGLEIHEGNIEDPAFSLTQRFDVIFANNIFEHLLAPHTFLITIKKFLKPDGILILGVPCIPKIVSLMRIGKFRGALATGHINFFTRETLIESVKHGGWDISAVRGYHFAPRYLDLLLDPIYPHFYVTATEDHGFAYPEKRRKELEGYK
jgi:SAM-dependent methyltransferase